jgi:hypothetical protein
MNEKFTPIKTDKCIMLNGRKFTVYNIDGFSFDKSLDITTEKGLYCFTYCYRIDLKNESFKNTFVVNHLPLYLGKAEGNDGINERLTSQHDKFVDLKGLANCLCIYICMNNEQPKVIESEILSSCGFIFNEQENTCKKIVTVKEVSVNNLP